MTKTIPRTLPAAPLVPWLKATCERETIEVFASRVGVSDRRIREVLNGHAKSMSFENVDKMITMDGHVNFFDFYPEYGDDEFFTINERYGDAIGVRPKRICAVSGCDLAVHGKGYCNRHYRQYAKGMIPS